MGPNDFIQYRHDIAISKALIGPNDLSSFSIFSETCCLKTVIVETQTMHRK